MKPDVVANMREEIGLRQFRVRYGHAVRLVNQLIRMIYCEKKLQEGEQFLTHVFTDESYIQLGKNSRTCFVKHRHQSIKPAPKYVQKVREKRERKRKELESLVTYLGRNQCQGT